MLEKIPIAAAIRSGLRRRCDEQIERLSDAARTAPWNRASKPLSVVLATRRIARSDLRNLGLLSVVLLHINAILLRFIGWAGGRATVKFMM